MLYIKKRFFSKEKNLIKKGEGGVTYFSIALLLLFLLWFLQFSAVRTCWFRRQCSVTFRSWYPLVLVDYSSRLCFNPMLGANRWRLSLLQLLYNIDDILRCDVLVVIVRE